MLPNHNCLYMVKFRKEPRKGHPERSEGSRFPIAVRDSHLPKGYRGDAAGGGGGMTNATLSNHSRGRELICCPQRLYWVLQFFIES